MHSSLGQVALGLGEQEVMWMNNNLQAKGVYWLSK